MTLSLVQTVTVGSGGAASIDFTSIPQTGTDLLLVLSLRSSAGAGFYGADIKLNNVSATGKGIFGSGSTVASYPFVTPSVAGTDKTANTFGSMTFYVPNYTGSSAKTASCDNVAENNATASAQEIFAMAYSSVTSAVTSISVAGLTTVSQYSTASLYTITKGSGGATVS